MSSTSAPSHNSASGAGGGGTSDNPFDFDVDFDKVQKRRQAALQKKAERQAEKDGTIVHKEPSSLSSSQLTSKKRADKDGKKKTTLGFGGLLAFQGGGKNKGLDDADSTGVFGGKRVTKWPYDDYHVVQKQYYVKLQDLQSEQQQQEEDDDDEHKNNGGTGRSRSSSAAINSSAASLSHQFQRPADPPEIPAAVRDLALSDFEHKAQERAIQFVSCWLFDAGLYEELLNEAPSSSSGSGSNAQTELSKMDKELAHLQASTQRQLSLINARLNDGVAASGAEVQELVNAVTATKDELGRLRELSTYISNDNDQADRSSKFLLTRYPKLKKAINARRNLARCFRELEFYSQIPVSCETLREELHGGEWTAHEWTTLRNVAREHVELEVFLVEAEAGMKKRIDEEAQGLLSGGGGGGEDGDHHEDGPTRERTGRRTSAVFRSQGRLPHNYEEVDHFLQDHVKNVWELGDEIRLRIMSGISGAFDLAMNNPSGMVALVEAVEVYEVASQEYKTVHGKAAGSTTSGAGGGDTQKSSNHGASLRFTDMRAAALTQMYQDFEMRGLEVFREVHESTDAHDEDDGEAINAKFSAILRACNGLTSEISFVQNQMAPCFPPHWALETLWSTCVAQVCSQQILEQIGGVEGHQLPDLTVTQLLDLVAWVENFRETIEESFPNISQHVTTSTYLNQRPELLMEDKKAVNLQVAKDSLAWANQMLWQVHDLAKDEFLYRTKEQTDEWLTNVYDADHTKNQTSEGRLITSLPEDVFSVAGVQLRTIRERLTRRSEALVNVVGLIFKNLFDQQSAKRDDFLLDLETCCAASNDFVRMSEKCEEIIEDIVAEANLSRDAEETLQEQAAMLLGLYSSDAVYAAQKNYVYIFEPIEDAISEELFGPEWLDEYTGNDLAVTLVRTLEDFLGDLEEFLDDLMVGKAVDALVTASINFYIGCLLATSAKHNSHKKGIWSDNEKALNRMMGDIKVMKEYFVSLSDSYPALNRSVDPEFEVLETIHELLSIASGVSSSSQRDFILFLQKRIRNIPITKLVVGDLWHLANPIEEKAIYELVDEMEDEMKAIAPTDETALELAANRKTVYGLRLDQSLAHALDEHGALRTRPGIKKTAAEQTEVMLNRWRETWKNVVFADRNNDDEDESDGEY